YNANRAEVNPPRALEVPIREADSAESIQEMPSTETTRAYCRQTWAVFMIGVYTGSPVKPSESLNWFPAFTKHFLNRISLLHAKCTPALRPHGKNKAGETLFPNFTSTPSASAARSAPRPRPSRTPAARLLESQ